MKVPRISTNKSILNKTYKTPIKQIYQPKTPAEQWWQDSCDKGERFWATLGAIAILTLGAVIFARISGKLPLTNAQNKDKYEDCRTTITKDEPVQNINKIL